MSEELKPCPNDRCTCDDPDVCAKHNAQMIREELQAGADLIIDSNLLPKPYGGEWIMSGEDAIEVLDAWNTRALPKVKPLEWKLGAMGYHADSIIGRYETYASVKAPHWLWRGENGISIDQYEGKEDSNEAAQAAAQADYERRIHAALETEKRTDQ